VGRAWLCSVTCFDAEGALDLAAQAALWERAAAAGVGIYVAGSSPGEGYALRPDEVVALLGLGVEIARGRVPVRAMGVEPRHAPQMQELLSLAKRGGADAAQIYSLDVGHGGRPTPQELERYLRRSLEASALPVALSSHAFIGYLLPLALVEQLAREYPHLVGINVTTPDIPYLSEAVDRLRGRLEICVGGPMHAVTALALGADGFLSTEAALVPARCAELVAAFERGDHATAFAAHAELMRWMRATSVVPGASVRRTKAAMAVLGLAGTGVREPHAPLEPAEIARLRDELARLGLAAAS
jgi:4-hydroxy-tetrahydrodipicolinate synthase